MIYEVKFPSPSVEKKFEKALEDIFPASLRLEIINRLESLAQNPRPMGSLKLKPPLYVYQVAAQYRIRVRDYRVLYDIDDLRKIVWIITVRRRNEGTYD